MTAAMPNFRRIDAATAKLDASIAACQPTGAVADDGVILLRASTLTPEPFRWLWLHWIALGKLHILAGAPGQGKTTINLAFVATVTSGGRWPDGSSCVPANALIWSGEDDPTDTLLPRLLAMGADTNRVYFVKAARIDGEVVPFDPARDMVQLTTEAERIGGVRLVMVDPVVSAVAGDSHKNTEVRRALQPLVDLAATLDCAVVGISHFGKNTAGKDPTERVVGSVAFGAVARVVMAAAKIKNDDGEERRILVRSKSNIGPDDGGFQYAINQVELEAHPGVHASRITWGAAIEGTACELLAEAEAGPNDDDASALDDACAFLRSELQGGPKPANYIFAEARGAGHSERTIKRAKAALGVESRKEGKSWAWALGPGDAKDAKGAKGTNSRNLGTLGTLGTIDAPIIERGADVEVFE